ncbi:MAG: hypothetical protein V3R55_06100, partial [Alphaproteobacteria bacterium]
MVLCGAGRYTPPMIGTDERPGPPSHRLMVPNAPVLVAGPRAATVITVDGEIETLSHAQAVACA